VGLLIPDPYSFLVQVSFTDTEIIASYFCHMVVLGEEGVVLYKACTVDLDSEQDTALMTLRLGYHSIKGILVSKDPGSIIRKYGEIE
jgi:hypothetical protein